MRRFADAYLRGDLDEALTYFDAGIVLKRAEEAAVYGREDARASLLRWEADWEELETIPEEFVGVGERVLVTVLFRGRGRASGAEVEGRFYEVITVRDGKVVEWDEFSERSAALGAVGLSE